MDRILVFGAKGYFGSRMVAAIPGAHGSAADITARGEVRAELDTFRPDAVINAVGKTGDSNIDWCEDNLHATMMSNLHGPIILNQECQDRHIHLTHLSSGCVYYGNNHGKGFSEEDRPNFLASSYSCIKFYAEEALKHFPVLILRPRLPFDGTFSSRNLLIKVRGYSLLIDIENSMTYVPDFIEAARFLISCRRTGIYHVVNSGVTTPFRVRELSGDKGFMRITQEELNQRVRAGRSNCVLSIDKLQKEDVFMRPVEEAVRIAWRKLGR